MGVTESAKRIVNGQLARLGYRISPISAVPSPERLFHMLENSTLRPETIFDVGVAYGTPWLYDAFPDAFLHLIDPTREARPYMEQIARARSAHIHNIALGDREGSCNIFVRPSIDGSSLFEEVGEAQILTSYAVPVKRFDQLFPKIARPSLVKIDVQGAELNVLRGMRSSLPEVDVLIVEVSLIATLKGAPEFAHVMQFLSAEKFCLYEIVGLTRRPLDGALAQLDAVFVPEQSPLRRDRRWTRGSLER